MPQVSFTSVGNNLDLTWFFSNTSVSATSYSWEFGDGTTSDETSPTHTYATAGTYNVCLTATSDCGSMRTCQNISISVGIGEQAARTNGIRLAPVPANDVLSVSSDGTRIAGVRLLDAAGRQVLAHAQANASRLDVPTAGLAAGTYVLEVTLADGSLRRLHAVIAH
ncbi:MAG: PKD domain-containing protein [Flavobacteriales bacterium]